MQRPSTTNRQLMKRRILVALAALGCAAACLLTAGTWAGAAAASVSPPRVPQIGRLSSIGHAAPERLVSAAASGPGRTRGSVVLSGSPGVPAANPKTNTVYVPIQCTDSSCQHAGHVVEVINTAKCNARVRSDCRVVATARVGSNPLAAAIDERTDTIYVVNGGSATVSVLNGARCNARVTRGCGRAIATIRVGKMPVAASVDPATRTVYVANLAGRSVSVIDAATCNAVTTRGCGRAARTVRDPAGPGAIDVDVAADTVYAANSGVSGNGDTVSVIDGAACNGHDGSGCGRAPRTVTVGSGVTVGIAPR